MAPRRPRSGPHRGPLGKCRGCGARVYWLTCLKHDGTLGGKAPIDVAPSFEGNITIDLPAERYSIVSKDDAALHRERCDAGAVPRLRVNHHVTCTNVTYRKARGRLHVPTGEEADAAAAWEADAVPRELSAPRPAVDPAPAPASAIALPAPGEYLVDPEEADGEPDE